MLTNLKLTLEIACESSQEALDLNENLYSAGFHSNYGGQLTYAVPKTSIVEVRVTPATNNLGPTIFAELESALQHAETFLAKYRSEQRRSLKNEIR